MIKIKRVYETPRDGDGLRILVDRIWPRGLSKRKARIDKWTKEIAPSHKLRKWFGHDPKKWRQFKHKYAKELESKTDLIEEIRRSSKGSTLTLVYSAKDEDHNQAVVLKEILQKD